MSTMCMCVYVCIYVSILCDDRQEYCIVYSCSCKSRKTKGSRLDPTCRVGPF